MHDLALLGVRGPEPWPGGRDAPEPTGGAPEPPDRPEPGYGWIVPGARQPLEPGSPVLDVETFVEWIHHPHQDPATANV